MGNTMKRMGVTLTALFAAMLALALALVPGAALATPTETTADAKITKAEPGAKVTLTKVAKFNTETNKYEWLVTADPSRPLPDLNTSTTPTITHEQWDDIIAATRATGSTLTTYGPLEVGADGTVTFAGPDNDLDRGIYVVTVENPDNSTFVYLNTGFGVNKSDFNTTVEVVLKGENVVPTKTVDKSSIAMGETATFTITSVIPNYDETATDRVYQIIDTLDPGLEFVDTTEDDGTVIPASVTVSTESGTLDESKYTVTKSDQTLTIDFSDSIVALNNQGDKTITVTLKAKRTAATAEVWNKVYTHFSTDSHTEYWSDTPKPEVPVYDFKVNLLKTDNSGNTALPDAEFTLTTTVDGTTYYVQSDGSLGDSAHTFTTDDDGYIHFTGLREGEYTLTETKAPDGYFINPATHTFKVEGVYETTTVKQPYTETKEVTENGQTTTVTTTEEIEYTYQKLTGYNLYLDNVLVDGKDIDGDANITLDEDGKVTEATAGLSIKNPEQGLLPHTGEAGTIALTVCGVGLVIFAASWAVRNHKKEEK